MAAVETDVRRGAWIDPRFGRITFGRYAELWLNALSDLRPRTIEQSNGLLKRYLLPAFGAVKLAQLKPSRVRTWYGELAAMHPTSAVNSYRLFRAIYNTAVRDDVVGSSPCRIIGGGSDRTPERPMPSVAQIETLAQVITERLRAAVLLAAWGGLRRGEVLGRQPHDVTELVGGIRIERTLHELHNGTVVYGPPKSAAGVRFVHLAKPTMSEVLGHVASYVAHQNDAPTFPAKNGVPLRPRNWEAEWRKARKPSGSSTSASTTYDTST